MVDHLILSEIRLIIGHVNCSYRPSYSNEFRAECANTY